MPVTQLTPLRARVCGGHFTDATQGQSLQPRPPRCPEGAISHQPSQEACRKQSISTLPQEPCFLGFVFAVPVLAPRSSGAHPPAAQEEVRGSCGQTRCGPSHLTPPPSEAAATRPSQRGGRSEARPPAHVHPLAPPRPPTWRTGPSSQCVSHIYLSGG